MSVSANLCLPEHASGAGNVTAMFASVPKASVHKNREVLFRKKEIRTTQDVGSVQLPSAYSSPDESQAQNPLSAPIAFTTDGRHNARTSGRDSHKFTVLQFRF
jgi:hypothetical protein